MFKQVQGESAVKQKGGASANDPVNSTLDQAWTLKIGDQISLWAETDDDGVPVHVYLSASGVSSQMVQVCGDNVQKYDTPKNFKECVFVVHCQYQYTAAKRYQKKLEMVGNRTEDDASSHIALFKKKRQQPNTSSANLRLTAVMKEKQKKGEDDTGDKTLSTQGKNKKKGDSDDGNKKIANRQVNNSVSKSGAPVAAGNNNDNSSSSNNSNDGGDGDDLEVLKNKRDNEMIENRIELERQIGKEVLYGQPIQLLHVKSNKFLTATRESAQLQKDCVRLSLDENGNTNSIFYIMPTYRYQTEGQRVMIHDHIYLVNRKSMSYLHLSRKKFDLRRSEVNMSTSQFKWSMRLFTPFIQPKIANRYLKAGDTIQLVHHSSDCSLEVDLEESSKAVRLCKRQNEFCSNSLFEIELSEPSRGGVLGWDNVYRFRHVATNQYLSIRPKSSVTTTDSTDVETDVKTPEKPTLDASRNWKLLKLRIMKDDFSSNSAIKKAQPISYDLCVDNNRESGSLFMIRPPNSLSSDIQLDNVFRICHYNSNTWLRTREVKSNVEKNGQVNSPNLITPLKWLEVESTPNMTEEEVFFAKIVPQQYIHDMSFVQGAYTTLESFIAALESGQSTKRSTLNRVIKVLTELCLFCTDSHVLDPMKREGIPHTSRQHYLREQLIPYQIFTILRMMRFSAEELKLESRVMEKDIIKLSYRFIRQCVKQNPANGFYLAPSINFLQSQLSLSGIGGINISQTLTELLSNNYSLLNSLSRSDIAPFVDLLFDNPRNSDNVAFLCTFACTNDRAVVKNQDFIRELLFVDEQKMKDKLLIPYLQGDTVMITIDEEVLPLTSFINYALADGSRAKYGKDLLQYVENTIELFSRLCMGRNTASIDLIANIIDIKVVQMCLENPEVTPTLKSSFCKLLLHCFINRPPYEQRPLIKLTRYLYKEGTVDTKGKESHIEYFANIKGFIFKFLYGNRKLDKSNFELNTFILNILKIVTSMLKYRIITTKEDIQQLMATLLRVLDGRDDTHNKQLMSATERFTTDESNSIITSIKLEICDIFNLLIDHAMNKKISFIVKYLIREMQENRILHIGSIDEKIFEPILKDLWLDHNSKHGTHLDEESFRGKLFTVLQDLQNYENHILARSALNLLFRIHNRKEELSHFLLRVELLVSRVMVITYYELNKNSSKLRSLIVGEGVLSIEGEEAAKVRRLMDALSNEAISTGRRAQRIMRNLKVHRLALETLNCNFHNPESRELLWTGAIRVLTEFVRDNPENQKIIYPRLESFFSKLWIPETSNLLTEIVKENRSLCVSIEEKTVRSYVHAITEQAHLCPRYLKFLRTIMHVDRKPLRKNQTFVINNLSQREKDVIVLFTGKSGSRDLQKRIERREHITEPQGLLNYHIELLHLFCDCAAGASHIAEVKLQSLLSINAVMEHLTDPNFTPAIRNPLIKFFSEVYINTEKEISLTESATAEKMWTLINMMQLEIRSYISRSTQSTLRIAMESTSTAQQITNHEELFVESSREVNAQYIYHVILPFIYLYYAKHFGKNIEFLPHHETICLNLLEALMLLYQKTCQPSQRVSIRKCAEAMYKKPLDVTRCSKEINDFIRIRIQSQKAKMHSDFERRVTRLLDERDEQLCKSLYNHLAYFENILIKDSDIVKASRIFQNEQELKNLMSVLRTSNQLGFDEHTETTIINALRVLQIVIQDVIDETTQSGGRDTTPITDVLSKMLRVDCHMLVIELICCPKNRIVKEALALGILLLFEGNDMAQFKFLQAFIETDSDLFFVSIRDRIRLAIKEIKARKNIMKKSRARQEALNETRIVQYNRKEKKSEDIQFVEAGFIVEVLRFLQQLTEGHNLTMQEYLNTQLFNNTSINLIDECLQYLLAIEDHIDSSSIHIVLQCFDTLTEFIQGPCRTNQAIIGLSSKFYMMVDGLLQKDFYDSSALLCFQVVKLQKKAMLTLISLLEGNTTSQLFTMMKNGISIETFKSALLQAAVFRSGGDDHALQERIFKENQRAFKENQQILYPNKREVITQLKKKYESLGFLLYMFLQTLRDKHLTINETVDKDLESWFKTNSSQLSFFSSSVSRIEVSRDNQLERLYFVKPESTNNLIDSTKSKFLYTCNRDTPQIKHRELFDITNKFRIEMEHYDAFKWNSKYQHSSIISVLIWSFMERYFREFKYFVLLISIILNAIFCCGWKQTHKIEAFGIPVPGVSLPSKSHLEGNYTYKEFEITMFSLGLFQMLLSLTVLLVYISFFAKLKIKKQFHFGRREKWSDLEWNWQFVLNYVYFSLRDRDFWIYLVHFAICVIGWAVTPAVYSLLLFEVAFRSQSLLNLLNAIRLNLKQLILTGVLMSFTILLFVTLYFVYRHNAYYAIGKEESPLKACENMWRCTQVFMHMTLRSEGMPEGGNYLRMPIYMDFPRTIIDMAYTFLVPIVLMEIVFGVILDSFAQLRSEREEKQSEIKTRCFICDIEKHRFDMRANENITFVHHVKREHNMWDYVYFLIYLFEKDVTEFTGTEQYIYDLACKEDTSFFPCLRSLTLEESDARTRRRHRQQGSTAKKNKSKKE